MSKNLDLRVLRTRRLIRDAFLKVIAEKGFESITINDITDNAQINRSTFYLHYTDKYDLLDKTVDDAIDKLMMLVVPETHLQKDSLDIEALKQNIIMILKMVEDDLLFYKTILGDHGMLDVRRKIIKALNTKLEKSLPAQTLIQKDLFIDLLLAIYLEAITWWLNNGMMYSANYIAEQLIMFITMGPSKSVRVKGIIT